MTTLRHRDIAGVSALRHGRRAAFLPGRQARTARRHWAPKAAPAPRAEVRQRAARFLRTGRDLLFGLWALAALGFCVVIVAALAL